MNSLPISLSGLGDGLDFLGLFEDFDGLLLGRLERLATGIDCLLLFDDQRLLLVIVPLRTLV